MFLQALDPESRDLLLSVAAPVSYVAGATLVRHGEAARGAYLLRVGTAEAVVTLPGGESLAVGRIEAGGIFGEMALVEAGTCMATIRATSHVDGWFIANEDFRALASQRNPAAIRVQHALTLALAEKLAALNAQLLACPAPEDRPARAVTNGIDPLAPVQRTRRVSFAAGAFLPRLPFFERFSAGEIDEIASAAAYVELPRGHAIFAALAPAQNAFLVVRGAAEILSIAGERERRIAIVGPGQLLGYVGVLRERPHASHAFAREAVVLLDFPAGIFRSLYFGTSRASALLRHGVQRSLLGALERTNRSLSRLLSQGKLAASARQGRQLEKALRERLAETAAG